MEQKYYEIEDDLLHDEDGRFAIDNDDKAEWALRVLRTEQNERDRLLRVCEAAIERYREKMALINSRYDTRTAYLTAELNTYFSTVPHKQTKTQEQYRLPSGKLVLRQRQPEFHRNDEILIDWAERRGRSELVKVKKSIDWAGLKKSVSVMGDDVVDSGTGEIIPGVAVEHRPPVFDVVLEKEDE